MSKTNEHIKDRRHLIEYNNNLTSQALRRAVTEGYKTPVVLLLDIRDPVAYRIAAPLLGKDQVDDQIAKHCRAGTIPTVVTVLEQEIALKAIGPTSPSAKAVLSSRLPNGCNHLICVANGGNTFALIGDDHADKEQQ